MVYHAAHKLTDMRGATSARELVSALRERRVHTPATQKFVSRGTRHSCPPELMAESKAIVSLRRSRRTLHAATVCNPNAFAMLLPRSAGLSATSTPQLRSASILACAVSLAPPMIAPA